ncbi:MAG: hypothetical protein PHT95_01445 [Candidatus Omnitrophica bacterium]|nr:hypothetical protein [Candidatus Omnitrophota bacterium]
MTCCDDGSIRKVLEAVGRGEPFYVLPYKEPKVWGIEGIGEYWYGAEAGQKSSIAVTTDGEIPMDTLVSSSPDTLLGADVVRMFGPRMPLVKILTPAGRLSVQFHDAKNELWIVTSASGSNPSIVLGFSESSVSKYGEKVTDEYRKALNDYGKALNALIDTLEKNGFKDELTRCGNARVAAERVLSGGASIAAALKDYDSAEEAMSWFYNIKPVKVGDVIPIPSGTMHALGSGVEIVEPQIAGPTQSLEDGATYPVRYYFPGYERPGSQKKLDTDRAGEMRKGVTDDEKPSILRSGSGCTVERLPGGFEDKGLEVHRITLGTGVSIEETGIKSFHVLTALEGKAWITAGGKRYEVPRASAGGKMLVVPAKAGCYRIEAGTKAQIVDTFTPVKAGR